MSALQPLDRGGSHDDRLVPPERIAEGRFDAEVNERRLDELGRLDPATNQMIRWSNGFFIRQKGFLGDVAHELCAAIAPMQMALGILEQRADARLRSYVQEVHEELQHMSDLVNELMSPAKGGLAQEPFELCSKPLVDVLLHRETLGRLPTENQLDEMTVACAVPDLLGRAIANVPRNSVRYVGETKRITLTGRIPDGGTVRCR